MDFRTAEPKPFLGYYPAIIPQSALDEGINLLSSATEPNGRRQTKRFTVGPPKKTAPLEEREQLRDQRSHSPRSLRAHANEAAW